MEDRASSATAWTPVARDDVPRELDELGRAQRQLAEALERTREASQAYLGKPTPASLSARERYYEALLRQAEAERAFYDAKNAVARARRR